MTARRLVRDGDSGPGSKSLHPPADFFKLSLKVTAKEFIWYAATRHRQGDKPNICVFAAYRGGSTWLMELLATEPGLRPVNEPFSPGLISATSVWLLPKYQNGQIINFDSEHAEQELRRYSDRVFSGELPVGSPWWVWRRGFPFRSDRLLLKILRAKSVIDWIDQTYHPDIVLLTRHPISRALSCIRNGWYGNAGAYLNNHRYRNEVIGAELAGYLDDVFADGSDIERHVLSWALEYLVPLRLIAQRPSWSFVSYEDTVLDPLGTLRSLATRLDLSDVDRMVARVNQPSRSSRLSEGSTVREIKEGGAAARLASWRKRVPPEQEKAALDLLERLQIPLYVAGEDRPMPWWSTSSPSSSRSAP